MSKIKRTRDVEGPVDIGMADRLKAAREAIYRTAKQGAVAVGMKPSTYTQHESGIRGYGAHLAKYADAFRVSPEWLLRGVGRGPKEPTPARAMRIPIVSNVSAGAMSRDDLLDEVKGHFEFAGLPPGDWIAFKVEGDSMDRISPPDSIILINLKDRRLVPNACYIVANKDGETTYKRWRPGPPPRFEPVSTNPAHEPFYPDNDVPVIGRVVYSVLKMV